MAEYITKEQALENFENAYQSSEDSQDFRYYFESFIQCLPKADVVEVPKGATNGDVIKTIFPNIEANEIKTDTGGYIEVKYLDTTDECDATAFRKNWWNAPYRKE